MMRFGQLFILFLFLGGCIQRDETSKIAGGSEAPIKFPEWAKDAVIYEVNLRQFTPEGTFRAFKTHLSRLKNLGVEVICLLPIHPIGQVKRKGKLGSYYAVKDYLNINKEYGTHEDFRDLVATAHDLGMYVILDWVSDQTAWDHPLRTEHPEWYLKSPEGRFILPLPTDREEVVALDYSNSALRDYMIEAMKYWVDEFDMDGFRCNISGHVPTDFWIQARADLSKSKAIFILAAWEDHELDTAFEMSYANELEYHMQLIAEGKESAASITNYLEKMLQTNAADHVKVNFTSNHNKNAWEGTVFDRFGKAAEAFAVLTYVVEGIPLIYSGQEVGLKKRLKFFEKDSIDWGDHPFNSMYDRLGKLKSDNQALWNGHWGGKVQLIPNDRKSQVVSFSRQKAGNSVVALFNLSPQSAKFSLQKDWFDEDYRRFKSRDRVRMLSEQTITLPAWGYELYIH
ncbi:MAG: alpha-amylase family glycosyl hydrolase [Cyclobacteriaceae bacterium]